MNEEIIVETSRNEKLKKNFKNKGGKQELNVIKQAEELPLRGQLDMKKEVGQDRKRLNSKDKEEAGGGEVILKTGNEMKKLEG